MDETFADGRLRLKRSPAEQDALLRRLRRSAGQVRGVQQLIVCNRSCLDAVQQMNVTLRRGARWRWW